jgi:hypothetical protein
MMIKKYFGREILLSATIFASLTTFVLASDDEDDAKDSDKSQSIILPTGQLITPTAAPDSTFELLNPDLPDFPNFVASNALTTVISPDQRTLLVLTSGYNLLTDKNGSDIASASEEYVFVYDISAGKAVRKQVLKVPNSNTQLPIPKSSFAEYKHIPRPTHNGAYWADKTKSFNFNVEDQLGDPQKFNRIVWRGLKGNVPYPDERNGADLSKNRVQLLKKAGIKLGNNLSGNPMVTSR